MTTTRKDVLIIQELLRFVLPLCRTCYFHAGRRMRKYERMIEGKEEKKKERKKGRKKKKEPKERKEE